MPVIAIPCFRALPSACDCRPGFCKAGETRNCRDLLKRAAKRPTSAAPDPSKQLRRTRMTPIQYADIATTKQRAARDMAIAQAVLSACQHARYTIPGEDSIDLAAIIATVKE